MLGCLNAPLLDQREKKQQHLVSLATRVMHITGSKIAFASPFFFFFLSLSLSLCLTLLCSVFTSHLPPCYLQPASQPIFPRSSWQRWWNIKRMPAPAHSTGVTLSLHHKRHFHTRTCSKSRQICSPTSVRCEDNCTLFKQMHYFSICQGFWSQKVQRKKPLLLYICKKMHFEPFRRVKLILLWHTLLF